MRTEDATEHKQARVPSGDFLQEGSLNSNRGNAQAPRQTWVNPVAVMEFFIDR